MAKKKGGKNRSKKGKQPVDDRAMFVKKAVFFTVVLAIVLGGVITLIVVLQMDSGGGIVDSEDNNNNENPPEQVYDFTLTDIDGNKIALSKVDSKLVLIDMMGLFCEPCKREIEELKVVRSTFSTSQLMIISVNVAVSSETQAQMLENRTSLGINWPMAFDTVGMAEKFGVQSIPSLVLLDTYGNSIKEWIPPSASPPSAEEMTEIISEQFIES